MFSKKIEEINPGELAQAFEDEPSNYVVIDVREIDEYIGDMGHIRGSIHIPLMELVRSIDKLRSETREMVFVCQSGERSYYACSFLKDQGIEHVKNLRGGMIQWHLSGLDVEYEQSGESP